MASPAQRRLESSDDEQDVEQASPGFLSASWRDESRANPTPETQSLYDAMRRLEERENTSLKRVRSKVGNEGESQNMRHGLLNQSAKARLAFMRKLGSCVVCKARRVRCSHFDATKFEEEYQLRKAREGGMQQLPIRSDGVPAAVAHLQAQVGRHPCGDCSQVFPDEAVLRRHIRRAHNRPFKCVFDFAGCPSTFASKNEWKRHVSSQHLLLNYWICQEDECSRVGNDGDKSKLHNGYIFYRKDLFTQHVRRMHMPGDVKRTLRDHQMKLGKGYPTDEDTRRAWEARLRRFQEQALRFRCKLPEHLKCPVDACLMDFLGPDAWDQRMEHVSRHLARASEGHEGNVVFGCPNDELLVQWASSPGVDIIQLREGNWVLYPQGRVVNLRGEPGVSRAPAGALGPLVSDSRSVGSSTRIADSGYGSMATMVMGKMKFGDDKSAQQAAANDQTAQATLETYSVASSLEPNTVSAYVDEFAEELRSTLPLLTREEWSIISPTLGDLLKEFSVRIAYEETLADSATCRMIMYLVHKYHRQIVAGLCNQDQDFTEEDSPVASEGMSLQEKLDRWSHYEKFEDNQHFDGHENELDTRIDDDDRCGEDGIGPDFAQVARYREVLLDSPAFEWLASRIVRETRTTTPKTDSADHIRSQILNTIGLPHHISRQSVLQHKRVRFYIRWQFLDHLRDQQYGSEFGLDPTAPEIIPSILTLTGSPKHAQATTCGEYMAQTWPQSGPQMLEFIMKLASPEAPPSLQTTLRDETIVARENDADTSLAVFTVFGNPYSIAEVGQQLAWLAGTFTTSASSGSVTFYTPSVFSMDRVSDGAIEDAWFFINWAESTAPTSVNGVCWLSMFRNPVVVTGYPISRRPIEAEGLEMAPSIMAALIKSRRVVDFRGATFLKGFSSMLAVTKVVADVVLWHHFFDPNGEYMACSDPRVNLSEPSTAVSVGAIQASRHIVGWCESIKTFVGAPDANYNIKWSALGRTHSKCAFQNVNVSGGKFISAGISIALGLRSKPQHIKFDADDYIDMLKVIRDRQFIMYDVEDQRAWLVGGASVVLHIFRAGARHDRNDPDLESVFIFDEKDLVNAEDPYSGSSAAFKVLSNFDNLELPLYGKPREVKQEETLKLGVKPEVATKITSSFVCLKDRIGKICNILADIMAHQDDVNTQNGVGFRLRTTPRAQLEGFDFMDIATGLGTLWPVVKTLHHMGRGWTDFTRAINAVTLFGKGFGELMEPALQATPPGRHPPRACKACHWNGPLPKGRDYLAASTHELSRIFERRGDMKLRPWRLVENIYWFTPEKAFEPCSCTRDHRHDRVQVLLPPKLAKRGIRTPGAMPRNGAVIFGHSKKYPLRWPATGEPGEGEPEMDVDKGLLSLFQDSGLGTSISSSSRDADEVESSKDDPWPGRRDLYTLENEQFIERFDDEEVTDDEIAIGDEDDDIDADGKDEDVEIGIDIIEDRKGKRKAIFPVSSMEEIRYSGGGSQRG